MKKASIYIFFFLFYFNSSFAEKVSIDPNNIFKNLRCLICQGQSVADSNSEFAQTIKIVVNDKIQDGSSEKEIYNFLIDKYGEWIVYKPSLNKAHLILWMLPYVIFIVGGIMIIMMVKNRRY